MSAQPRICLQKNAGATLPWMLDREGNQVAVHDIPERLTELCAGLMEIARDCVPVEAELSAGDIELLLLVAHRRAYLDFLEEASAQAAAGHTALVPDDHAAPGVVQDTPIVPGCYETALQASATAAAAAGMLGRDTPLSFALCRPPGHHAGPEYFGGYCYLNNACVAAARLLRDGWHKVAIIDTDFHYGNGTAAIAGEHEAMFFASLHSDTNISYPFVPAPEPHPRRWLRAFRSPPSTTEYLDALSDAVAAAVAFGSRAIVLSMGYDIIDRDPHGGWSFEPSFFAAIGGRIRDSGVPICVVQEGGYLLEELRACAHHLARGLLGSDHAGRQP